jgi:crotonobetainyl-CoA:carnitine CoA-transferase CaiB-like acyl-CoA transferase
VTDRQDPPGLSAPLAGIRVVDFSRIVSGPFATQILGDLGADVIKVEFVGTGDEVRTYGVDKSLDPLTAARRPGATFLALNRNKRSIAIDVRADAGREAALRLLDSADVVLENFRTGVMDRLGLGYDAISARNPGVVYCSISGFGTSGPLAEKPANDVAIQAQTGLLSIIGEPGGPPVRIPTPVCDMTAGLYAVIGILTALGVSRETGRGQHVATNMFEGQLSMLAIMLVDYWTTGYLPQKMGSRTRMGQPNQAFPTEDGWVCIVAANESAWVRCCQALGVPELADDERFATLADRYAHVDELADTLSALTSKMTTEECVERLERARVVCAPVNTLQQVTEHPQFQALRASGGIASTPVGDLGEVPLVLSPIHLSQARITPPLAPPMLGEHTDELLADLGYTEQEISELRRQGIAG